MTHFPLPDGRTPATPCNVERLAYTEYNGAPVQVALWAKVFQFYQRGGPIEDICGHFDLSAIEVNDCITRYVRWRNIPPKGREPLSNSTRTA